MSDGYSVSSGPAGSPGLDPLVFYSGIFNPTVFYFMVIFRKLTPHFLALDCQNRFLDFRNREALPHKSFSDILINFGPLGWYLKTNLDLKKLIK